MVHITRHLCRMKKKKVIISPSLNLLVLVSFVKTGHAGSISIIATVHQSRALIFDLSSADFNAAFGDLTWHEMGSVDR